MRFLNTPIDVDLDQRGNPRLIHWRRGRYQVREINEVWITRGRWWAGEEERLFMRVETDRAQLVIYRRGRGGTEWCLYQMID